ncbi:unnamed protein product [Adineta steineri]|uniref:Uncharacterized protein n=1 Tax=Adineta steineri TaxID=433720 RepID=A0A813XRC7_9BILA|nr:unnamed protein product [Adineta steineri]CAF1357974.1 unnamed protein product [Adineta steineri]
MSKILLFTAIFFLAAIELGFCGSKVCYQCDEKHPSSKWKFWGEKITKCSNVPFEKYATKTSKALGAAVLTCYTKFDQAGNVIKRSAYGLGEAYDKNYKCRDRYHICCRTPLCNEHIQAPCPPAPSPTPRKEVKACYKCKGAEACRPDKLSGTELRTSGIFGAKNLYCYTHFDPKTGVAIERGAFGFGEAFDKSVKCDAKHYICCYDNMCNTHTAGLCPRKYNDHA